MTLRVLDIIYQTVVDGIGLRNTFYFAGCSRHCFNCHNPESWSFEAGEEMTIDEILEIVKSDEFNITLSGGDIMFQPDACYELVKRIKEETTKTVWIYTGFTLQECLDDPKKRRILPYIEALVDGPYIDSLRTDQKPFVGSLNQNVNFIKDLNIKGAHL